MDDKEQRELERYKWLVRTGLGILIAMFISWETWQAMTIVSHSNSLSAVVEEFEDAEGQRNAIRSLLEEVRSDQRTQSQTLNDIRLNLEVKLARLEAAGDVEAAETIRRELEDLPPEE